MSSKLGIFQIKKFSADELLKTKPKTLEGLSPINDEENYSMKVNEVTIYDVRNYKIIYGKSYVIIKFINSKNQEIACLSAFGSSKDDKFPKPDENFYVGYGLIMSETSFRIMKGIIEEKK